MTTGDSTDVQPPVQHDCWADGRLKRLFWTMFVVGAGLGSMATSLAFGFMLS